MRRLRILVVGALLALGVSFLTVPPAQAWGDIDNCGANHVSRTVNRWTPFAGHYMDTAVGMCRDGGNITTPPHFIWVKVPTITFPTRNVIASPLESLDLVQAPYLVDTDHCYTGTYTCKVTYRWSVKQCVLKIGCQTFDFKARMTMYTSTICFAPDGACDDPKSWP